MLFCLIGSAYLGGNKVLSGYNRLWEHVGPHLYILCHSLFCNHYPLALVGLAVLLCSVLLVYLPTMV